MNAALLALFAPSTAPAVSAIQSFYNVKAGGTLGDGITPTTVAIQQAVDVCIASGVTEREP